MGLGVGRDVLVGGDGSPPRVRDEFTRHVAADSQATVRTRFGDTGEDVPLLEVARFQGPRRPAVFDRSLDQLGRTGGTRTGPTAEREGGARVLGHVENRTVLGNLDASFATVCQNEDDRVGGRIAAHSQTSLVQSPSGHRISWARAGPAGRSPKSTRNSSSSVSDPSSGSTSAFSITEPRSPSSG